LSEILNQPAPDALGLLLSRRSGSAKAMIGPGPNDEELRTILKAATRVPDHGKLFPWRFIIFEGDARARMGETIAACLRQSDPSVSAERLDIERARFLRAPVIVGVVSRVKSGIPIPEWEQQLSAGAVCQTMLIAATAMGFVANWLTEWCAYDSRVGERLGLDVGERIAGFVYIGKPSVPLEERVRPELEKLVSWF
jgi:nitroreductase